MTANIDV